MLVGIDVLDVVRMEKFVQNEHFLEKYFTEYEIEYVNKNNRMTQSLAGIYSAKEAFLKALGIGIGGGIKLNEPAVDLGVAVSIMSGFRNKAIKPGGVIMGEVGLTGEIRGVNLIEKRIYEAEKTGFSYCVIPKSNAKNLENKFKIEIIEAENIQNILNKICE